MDIREVAARAEKLFSDCTQIGGEGAQMAIVGYMRGVSSGAITIGQSWLANLFISGSQLQYNAEQKAVLLDVFASGMCCEGQALGDTRGKTFAERNT